MKEQFTEKEQADGSKKKISQGMLTLEDATTFYASIEEMPGKWADDATSLIDGTDHVLWFESIEHSDVVKDTVRDLRSMVAEGSEIREVVKEMLQEMCKGGLPLWRHHTEEHREGGCARSMIRTDALWCF